MAPKTKAPPGWLITVHPPIVDLWFSVRQKNQTKLSLNQLMANIYYHEHVPSVANTLVFSSRDIIRYANNRVQNHKRTTGPTIKQVTIDSLLEHHIKTNKFIDELYDKEFNTRQPTMSNSDDDSDDASYSVTNNNPDALADLFQNALAIKGGRRSTQASRKSKLTLRTLSDSGGNDHGIQIIFGVSAKLSDHREEYFNYFTIMIPLPSPNDEQKYKLEVVPDPTHPGKTILQLTSPRNSLAWKNDTKLVCAVMDGYEMERNHGNNDYNSHLKNLISAAEIQLQLMEDNDDPIVELFKVIDASGVQVSPHDQCWQTPNWNEPAKKTGRINLNIIPVKINVNNKQTNKPVEKVFGKDIPGLRFYLSGMIAHGAGSGRNMRKAEELTRPPNFLQDLVDGAGELETELSPVRPARGK